MTIQEQVRAFVLHPSRRKSLTVSGIEAQAGISAGDFAKFLAGKRGLPEARLAALLPIIIAVGFGVVFDEPVPGEMPKPWGETLPMFTDAVPEPADVPVHQPEPMTPAEDPNAAWRQELERQDELATMPTWQQAQEKQYARELADNAELLEWINMPAEETSRDIAAWIKTFKNRRMLTGLVIQLRVQAPFIDVKSSWRCWLELTEADGKIYADRHNKDIVYKKKASPAFCESIFSSPFWKETNLGGISFFTQPIGNPVIEPKPKPEKPKKARPVAAAAPRIVVPLVDSFVFDENAINPLMTI